MTMTAAQALRAVADGEPVDDDAGEWLRDHGLLTKRKGAWKLTAAGKTQLAPAPEPAPVEDATREEIAARLRPQPDSPNPTDVASGDDG